jgi:hypothetical protein
MPAKSNKTLNQVALYNAGDILAVYQDGSTDNFTIAVVKSDVMSDKSELVGYLAHRTDEPNTFLVLRT